jgi:hypothetical protein
MWPYEGILKNWTLILSEITNKIRIQRGPWIRIQEGIMWPLIQK